MDVLGGSPCTPVTPTCTAHKGGGFGFEQTQLGQFSHPHLRAAGTLQGVPPSCCERRAAVWSGVCSSRHQGLDKAREQPANLAVEGKEESLSILPDYKPTVRSPPKRC